MISRAWSFFGLVPVLVGTAAISGWFFGASILVQYSSDMIPLALNTALCFLLIGSAYLCVFIRNQTYKKIQLALALTVAILATLCLSQDIFNVNLGFDQWLLNVFTIKTPVSPARMDANSALSFILISIVLVFMPSGRNKLIGVITDIIIFTIFIISVLGISSFVMKLEFSHGWYNYTRMALPNAICFLSLSLGLWGLWHSSHAWRTLYHDREDTKIILVSGSILFCIAIIVTLINFASIIHQENNEIKRTFLNLIRNENVIFTEDVNQGISKANDLRMDKQFIQAIQNVSQATIKDKPNITHTIQHLLSKAGFSGVNVIGNDGKVLYSQGNFLQNPQISIGKNTPSGYVNIIWAAEGWFELITNAISVNNKKIALLLIERPLRNMDVAFAKNNALGITGDILICQPGNNTRSKCFSTRNQAVYLIPKQKYYQALPIQYALQNKYGLMYVYDAEYKRVINAFGPLGNSGLGLVVHMALAEIYQPVIQSLQTIIPAILLSILLGLLLIRLQVIPLVRRVINAERDLKKTNLRLQKSDERFGLAIRGGKTGVWDWQVQSEEVFYSPFLKSMLGYTDAEFPNTLSSFNRIIHPEDADRVWLAVDYHLKDHVPYDIEYRLKPKNGSYQWFHSLGQAVWDDEGNPVRMTGFLMNITERKKIDQRLAIQLVVTQTLSEGQDLPSIAATLARGVAETLGWEFGALWIVDTKLHAIRCLGAWAHPSLPEGDALLEQTLTVELAKGSSLPGRVWETGQPLWVFDISRDIKMQRSLILLKNNLNSAFCFPILLHNKVVGVLEFISRERQSPDESMMQTMILIGSQIGQFMRRNNTEKQLRENEAYKSAILASASDSIMTINDDGKILIANPRSQQIFGYTPAELQTKNIADIFPNITLKLKSFSSKLAGDLVGQRKDGEKIDIELTISKMNFADKNLLVCLIRDVSERKKIEKLKDEFVSVISHELKVPLSSIRESLCLIINEAVGPVPIQAKKLLMIAHRSAQRLIQIINDILDIEKIQAGKMQFLLKDIEINKVVSQALEDNKAVVDQFGIQLQLIKTDVTAEVAVDPQRLLQVLSNLIENAAEVSKAGDVVFLKILRVNNKVRVEVSDSRESLPDSFHKNIFEKRPSVHSDTTSGDGPGLSLSICKAIIETFAGTIDFYIAEQGTTVYYFDLPIVGGDAPIIEIQPEPVARLGSLLICEDDEAQAKYLQQLLNTAGYHVDITFNAAQTKELLKQNTYTALLLDLNLPDYNGIALIRELRNSVQTRNLPIILISIIAHMGKSLWQGDVVSIINWFAKPVDLKKLAESIKSLRELLHKDTLSVLHIEDDPNTRRIITRILQDSAVITEVDNLNKAKKILLKQHFDLVILDLLLPDGNGADLLPTLAKLRTPVIVFSAAEKDAEFGKYVKQALTKTENSSEFLLNTIRNIIELGE